MTLHIYFHRKKDNAILKEIKELKQLIVSGLATESILKELAVKLKTGRESLQKEIDKVS